MIAVLEVSPSCLVGRRCWLGVLGDRAGRLDEEAERVLATNLVIADPLDPSLPKRAKDGSLLGEVLLLLIAHPTKFRAQVLVLLDRHLGQPLDIQGRLPPVSG